MGRPFSDIKASDLARTLRAAADRLDEQPDREDDDGCFHVVDAEVRTMLASLGWQA